MEFLTMRDLVKPSTRKSEIEAENQFTKFEKILYIYNHKTKHNKTGRTQADIFIFAGIPAYNTQPN